VAADIPGLLDLFDQLRAAGPRRSVPMPSDPSTMREGAADRFRTVIADPDQRLIVAEDADGLAGMVLCSIGTSSTLATAPAVVLSHLTVAANSRRAGVGRVLVAAATQWAAECDVDHLRVAVYASSREANRFFARLGFAPVSVNRVAPVAALRRILGAEVPAAEADSGDGARRRRLRLGITGGGRQTAPARRRVSG
jgi:GNAT superfamily N-acetyltransferase